VGGCGVIWATRQMKTGLLHWGKVGWLITCGQAAQAQ
jgi:uncharacterized protein YycO